MYIQITKDKYTWSVYLFGTEMEYNQDKYMLK